MKRFELYRMKDNKTPLSESYFNPIWLDIDARLDSLESVKVSWEEAVRELTDRALLRINEAVLPSFQYIESKKGEIDVLINNLEDKLSEISSLMESIQDAVNSAIGEMEEAVNAAIQAVNQELNNLKEKLVAMIFFGGD